MLNALVSNDYHHLVKVSDTYKTYEYNIEKLNEEIKEQGYICIPITEYEKLKSDLEKANEEITHLYEDMAGEDL